MRRSPLDAPGRRLVHGLEWVSRYAVEQWCECMRAAPPVFIEIDSSEFDRGRARGHIEAADMILANIRSGKFSPEHAGEVASIGCGEATS